MAQPYNNYNPQIHYRYSDDEYDPQIDPIPENHSNLITWTCHRCSFENHKYRHMCEVCRENRPQRQQERKQPINDTPDTISIDIFMNKTEAEKFLCSICQSVFTTPYSIGCNQDHLFCEDCIVAYYNQDTVKRCPECRQEGLRRTDIRPRKYVERLVNCLIVRCKLINDEKQDDVICDWKGELGNLKKHIQFDCPLMDTACKHCKHIFKRYQSEAHMKVCRSRPIPCVLKCNALIPRWFMDEHISTECMMSIQRCDECKQEVTKREMKAHGCTKINCPYIKYGCSKTIPNRDMKAHMEREEVTHLKMKIATLEHKVSLVEQCPQCNVCKHNEYQPGSYEENAWPSYSNVRSRSYSRGRGYGREGRPGRSVSFQYRSRHRYNDPAVARAYYQRIRRYSPPNDDASTQAQQFNSDNSEHLHTPPPMY